MCGIDEPFCSDSLAEKSEISERIVQAFDEFGTSGDFRKILEKHFLVQWPHELGTIEKVEAALKSAREVEDLPGKIFAFVQSVANIHSGGWFQFGFCNAEVMQAVQRRYPARLAFAREVATQILPESPYSFFQCFKDGLSEFEIFLLSFSQIFYGHSCHLTTLILGDQHLESIGQRERHNILWSVFKCMVQWDGSFKKNLEKLFSWECHASVPNRETLLFRDAFDFLYEWVASDAQSRGFSPSLELLDSFLGFLYERISEALRQSCEGLSASCNDEGRTIFNNWVSKWREETVHKLSKAWCCNVSLDGLSDDSFNLWSRRSYECFLPLCKELCEDRASLLIAWGIEENLKKWLDPKVKNGWLLDEGAYSRLWYLSAFREKWRRQLLNSINSLPSKDKLKVLSQRFGWNIGISAYLLPQYISLPKQSLKQGKSDFGRYEFQVEEADRDWWDSLLRTFPNEESFPKELYPFWTLEALYRFGYCDDLAPFGDKSLGIVRGYFMSGEIELTIEDIDKLIKILECFSPEKAMRHRLLLLRNSQQPYATENLDIDRTSLSPWSMSEILERMTHSYIEESRGRSLSREEWVSEESQFLSSVRGWVAHFCLSRLKLRKGEKAGGDSYNSKQVVEQSPVWRKAYLKVLEELGVDLHGKVHKAVFFTRKFDPVEDVREVAKTCYKAVRREYNKSEAATDIRRGLIAAYWWLLLAQRHALGLPVNEEEAVKTRRRLLRRP